MALTPYVTINYVNNQAPARNANNLNHAEAGIYDVTQETIIQASQILALASPTLVDYQPTAQPPIHLEGRVYYDEPTHSLAYFNDIDDMTVNIGQEVLVRVYNNTIAPILNGTPIHGTQTVVNGVPCIAPSIADSLTNAIVSGVTTTDILVGEEGFVTLVGSVGDVDTSAWLAGTRLYLSDTVEGGLTDQKNLIVSYVGTVIVRDVQGKIVVNPASLLELPTVAYYLQKLTTPAVTVSATPTQFVDYITGGGKILTGDKLAGTIDVLASGLYIVKTSFVISDISSSNDAQTIWVELYINGLPSGKRYPLIVGRSAEEVSATPYSELQLVEGDVLSLWHDSDDIAESVTVESISFSLTSINLDY